jgi:hypothetical protein
MGGAGLVSDTFCWRCGTFWKHFATVEAYICAWCIRCLLSAVSTHDLWDVLWVGCAALYGLRNAHTFFICGEVRNAHTACMLLCCAPPVGCSSMTGLRGNHIYSAAMIGRCGVVDN